MLKQSNNAISNYTVKYDKISAHGVVLKLRGVAGGNVG